MNVQGGRLLFVTNWLIVQCPPVGLIWPKPRDVWHPVSKPVWRMGQVAVVHTATVLLSGVLSPFAEWPSLLAHGRVQSDNWLVAQGGPSNCAQAASGTRQTLTRTTCVPVQTVCHWHL